MNATKIVCESAETIWLLIALFTVGGIASGFLIGYGLGLIEGKSRVGYRR